MAQENLNHEQQLKYHIKKAKILAELGLYSTSLLEEQKTIRLIVSQNLIDSNSKYYTKVKSECLYRIARMNLNIGLYEQSIKHLYDIIENYCNINPSKGLFLT